ncbi:MAG: hypothetical protein SVT56_08175 [Chloroflexota bacterium]|nr:hypothetical protein [Chloroflexota bacterium]
MAKFSASQFQKSISGSIEELARLLDEAQISKEIEVYLDTIAKFHNPTSSSS